MKIIKSTSTELIISFSHNIRLCGQRHSNRLTGSSVWETWFEKYGKWKVHDNPFDQKDFEIVEKWGIVKANSYNGVRLAKRWNYKKDIMEAINTLGAEVE